MSPRPARPGVRFGTSRVGILAIRVILSMYDPCQASSRAESKGRGTIEPCVSQLAPTTPFGPARSWPSPATTRLKRDAIATRQDIPVEFLESVLLALKHAGIVQSQRGASGGFRLARPAADISLADVIRAVDGPMADVRGGRPEEATYPGAGGAAPGHLDRPACQPAGDPRGHDPRGARGGSAAARGSAPRLQPGRVGLAGPRPSKPPVLRRGRRPSLAGSPKGG